MFPERLTDGYKAFVAARLPRERERFEELAASGQKPEIMVIGCCDSRVSPEVIFDARPGELFVVRNVANLVPPYEPDGEPHGTSAAVEYAVTALKVAHLIVLGHSSCGGVKGCYDMCSGHAPELDKKSSFVGRWMDILRPGFERLSPGSDEERTRQLEKEAVVVSLENLMTFPFVKAAVEDDMLSLHGLWNDIGEGGLEYFDGETGAFAPI